MKDDISALSSDGASGHTIRRIPLDDAALRNIAGGMDVDASTPEPVTIVGGRCPFCGEDMITSGLQGRLDHDSSPIPGSEGLVFICQKTGRTGIGKIVY